MAGQIEVTVALGGMETLERETSKRKAEGLER